MRGKGRQGACTSYRFDCDCVLYSKDGHEQTQVQRRVRVTPVERAMTGSRIARCSKKTMIRGNASGACIVAQHQRTHHALCAANRTEPRTSFFSSQGTPCFVSISTLCSASKESSGHLQGGNHGADK